MQKKRMLAEVFFSAREPKEGKKCMLNNVSLVPSVLILL
jgi:hypothetical protein